MAGARFSHLFRVEMFVMRKGLEFLQEGTPLNIKEIHIFNTPNFIDKFLRE